MGARNMTPTEYSYIKELLGKKGARIGKVAHTVNRSPATVRYIKRSKSYEEYEKIRPQGSQERTKKEVSGQRSLEMGEVAARPISEKPRSVAKEKLQPKPNKDYSGAILAQTAALVKALYVTNSTLQRVESLLKQRAGSHASYTSYLPSTKGDILPPERSPQPEPQPKKLSLTEAAGIILTAVALTLIALYFLGR